MRNAEGIDSCVLPLFLREYLKNALDIFKNKQYFVGKILQKYYITALYKNLHRCP